MTHPIIAFVTKRFESFRDRPEMWGSNESLELQAIQLIEIETFLRFPEKYENGRIPIDTYIRHMSKVTRLGNRPLHQHIENPKDFAIKLFDICQSTRADVEKECADAPKDI